MNRIEIDGITGEVKFIHCINGSFSYVAALGIDRPGQSPQPLTEKRFGNRVIAEDWILEQLSLPKSFLVLKYLK